MKKICCLSSLVRLCAIPLNLALSQALARAVSGATQGDVQIGRASVGKECEVPG